jgi:hypothetical protein
VCKEKESFMRTQRPQQTDKQLAPEQAEAQLGMAFLLEVRRSALAVETAAETLHRAAKMLRKVIEKHLGVIEK